MDDTTISAITLSYYVIISLISSLILLYYFNNKRIRIYSVISILVILVIALFTGSKKSILVPVFFILLYNIIRYRKKTIKLILSMGLISVILVILWNFIKEIDILQKYFVDRFESFFLIFSGEGVVEDQSTSLRLKFIPYALGLFLDNPIFGTFGLGYAIDLYLTNLKVNHPHNTVLEILAGTGLIGFTIYYGIIVKIIQRLRRILSDNFALILLCAIMSILFNQFNSQSYNVPVLNVYFSIAYSYLTIKKNENSVS